MDRFVFTISEVKMMISVVMPLYNNEHEVQRAMRSVLAQTHKNFELLVINDGSTDSSVMVVQSIHDERIVLVHQKNQGVSAARNAGIRLAKNDLIAFIDADDEWKPNFLDTIVSLSTTFPECAVFAANYWYCEQNGTLRETILRGVSPIPFSGVLHNYFDIARRSDPPLWSSAIAVRKEAMDSVGGFPAGITIGEDLLTWARLAARYSIAYTSVRCAIFYLKAPLAGVPSRIPQEPDVVGCALEELQGSIAVEHQPAFKKYIAMWHRMRAAMFLGLKKRVKTLYEVQYSLRFHPGNTSLYAYIMLALLPDFVGVKFNILFSYLKTKRRRVIS